MPRVRSAATHLRGNPIDVIGDELAVGQKAPRFELVDQDLQSVTLADTTGTVRIISTVPSLDTAVCAIETKHWQDEIEKLGDWAELITVSMDLPFAQKRYCVEAGITHAILSAHADESFGRDWGVLIKARPLRRLLQRAVFVLDRDDTIRYAEYCPEIADQPVFDRAIEVAKRLASERNEIS